MKVYIVWDEKHNDNRVFSEKDKAAALEYYASTVRKLFKEMGSRYCTVVNGETMAFDDNGRNVEQAVEFKSTVFGGRKIAIEEGRLIDKD